MRRGTVSAVRVEVAAHRYRVTTDTGSLLAWWALTARGLRLKLGAALSACGLGWFSDTELDWMIGNARRYGYVIVGCGYVIVAQLKQ